MAKGGSSRSGPPPSPDALRRERDGSSWVELPADGYDGPLPDWPLTSPSGRELDLWAGHWSRPQAAVWAAHGLEYEVALYVRNLVQAEVVGSAASRSTLVKQLMEDLGLTEAGLVRNRWRIVVAGEGRPARRHSASARDKLKVVPMRKEQSDD